MQTGNLVRDNTPEISSSKSKGEALSWHVADDIEYVEKLHAKLRTDIDSFLQSEDEEGIAEILEVLDAISAHHGLSKEDIVMAKDFKKAKYGGFEKRIILEE